MSVLGNRSNITSDVCSGHYAKQVVLIIRDVETSGNHQNVVMQGVIQVTVANYILFTDHMFL